jgi:hypothetical protein
VFFFFAFAGIFFSGQRWIPFLTALAITVTVVVYLYYLYQREFFWFSLFTAAGCFCLYLADTSASPLAEDHRIIFKVLLAAAAVFIFAFALTLMKNKGRLKFKSLDLKILEQSAKYFQFFVLSAIIAVFAAAGFLPAALVFFSFFYLICALLAYFIIIGIYFTVKII